MTRQNRDLVVNCIVNRPLRYTGLIEATNSFGSDALVIIGPAPTANHVPLSKIPLNYVRRSHCPSSIICMQIPRYHVHQTNTSCIQMTEPTVSAPISPPPSCNDMARSGAMGRDLLEYVLPICRRGRRYPVGSVIRLGGGVITHTPNLISVIYLYYYSS